MRSNKFGHFVQSSGITDTHVSVQGLYLSPSKRLAVCESNFGDCQVCFQCFPTTNEQTSWRIPHFYGWRTNFHTLGRPSSRLPSSNSIRKWPASCCRYVPSPRPIIIHYNPRSKSRDRSNVRAWKSTTFHGYWMYQPLLDDFWYLVTRLANGICKNSDCGLFSHEGGRSLVFPGIVVETGFSDPLKKSRRDIRLWLDCSELSVFEFQSCCWPQIGEIGNCMQSCCHATKAVYYSQVRVLEHWSK